MKLSFSTLCCLDASPARVIDYALSNGISGVEARVNEKGETFSHCGISDAEEIREMFADAGITVTDLALSCSIREYDTAQIEAGKNGIDFAAAIGSEAVRIFVGVHQEKFTDKVINDTEGITGALLELSAYGKEKGVEIWLETHSSYSSGKAMSELVASLGRDNIKVIWDVLHTLEYRESPEETVTYLGRKIAHVHLKDGYRASGDATQFIHTDLGKGAVPVKEILSALGKIDYDGFLSLEWESPWRDEIRSLYPDINDLLSSYRRFLDV